jgi:predicted membrane-bound spermidine synthase
VVTLGGDGHFTPLTHVACNALADKVLALRLATSTIDTVHNVTALSVTAVVARIAQTTLTFLGTAIWVRHACGVILALLRLSARHGEQLARVAGPALRTVAHKRVLDALLPVLTHSVILAPALTLVHIALVPCVAGVVTATVRLVPVVVVTRGVVRTVVVTLELTALLAAARRAVSHHVIALTTHTVRQLIIPDRAVAVCLWLVTLVWGTVTSAHLTFLT